MSKPQQPSSYEKRSISWAIPAFLLLINAGAFFLCAFGSPWSDSIIVGLIIMALSAIPLAALAYLTIRIYRYGNQLQDEIRTEMATAEPEQLTVRAGRLRNYMLRTREEAGALARGNAQGLSAASYALPATASGLVAGMEGYVMQHYVAGEDLRLDALRNFLSEYVLDRVERLQRDHELAFRIGLAGTVLGLGVQIFLTQLLTHSSILSQTFLTGVVLKASSTFVGILVAWYARSLRWKLLEQYDDLVVRLEAFASYRLAPLFAALHAERGDVAEALRDIIEDLKVTVAGIETTLSNALSKAVKDASRVLGDTLKETFAAELAESIEGQITGPFRVEVERLKNAISRSGDSINEGVRQLKDGTREFKQEFSNMVRASFTIGDRLQDASHVLSSLTHKFEEVVAQADQVAQTLRDSQSEVAIAIERNRDHDGDGNDHWVRGEVEKMMHSMHEDRQGFNRMIDNLARMIDELGPSRPRNK